MSMTTNMHNVRFVVSNSKLKCIASLRIWKAYEIENTCTRAHI